MEDKNPSTDTTTKMTPKTNVDPDSPKTTILVVDDEQDARDLFVELFKSANKYNVLSAVDGNDALEKCAKNKVDLILLDIVMPNLDGVDTLATIKTSPDKYGNPIVIMLTNIGGDLAIQEALKIGAVSYKLKIDTEPEELLQTVEEALVKYQGENNKPGIPSAPDSESKPGIVPVPDDAKEEANAVA